MPPSASSSPAAADSSRPPTSVDLLNTTTHQAPLHLISDRRSATMGLYFPFWTASKCQGCLLGRCKFSEGALFTHKQEAQHHLILKQASYVEGTGNVLLRSVITNHRNQQSFPHRIMQRKAAQRHGTTPPVTVPGWTAGTKAIQQQKAFQWIAFGCLIPSVVGITL